MNESIIPKVTVIKEDGIHYVINCPYCNKKHYHGIGYGHRAAHCIHPDSRPGYILVKYKPEEVKCQ